MQYQLEEHVFLALRPLLVALFDRFESYCDPEDSTKTLDARHSLCLLREMGFISGRGRDNRQDEAQLWATAEVNGSQLDFSAIVYFVYSLRAEKRLTVAEDLMKCFNTYDKEHVGSLSLAEASQALGYLELAPRTREEQENMRPLFFEADPAGEGRLSAACFQALCLRVEEQMHLLLYEAGYQKSMEVGLTEPEVREMWGLFHSPKTEEPPPDSPPLSPPASRRVSVTSLRHALLDGQASLEGGSLQLLSENPEPVRQRRTSQVAFATFIVGSKQAPRHLASLQAEDERPRESQICFPWALRRALMELRLPKDYINSLENSELIVVVADYFGFAVAGPLEEIRVAFATKLNVRSWSEFQASARELGKRMADVPEEQGLSDRGALAASLGLT